MSPARRYRKAVHQRKQDLRRMVANRLITEGEAAQVLQMYRLQKFVSINEAEKQRWCHNIGGICIYGEKQHE